MADKGKRKTNPIGSEPWERELDAAVAEDDGPLLGRDHGHPDDDDAMGDGVTVGEARKRIYGTKKK